MRQETVTLRFARVLTPQAIENVHARILDEGRLHRRIHDLLARTTAGEPITIRIDPQTLASTDPKDIERILRTSGLSLVGAGLADYALDLVSVLGQQARAEPQIELVAGYAEYTRARYLAADGHLAEALVKADALRPEDRYVLNTLRNACDYQTGRIDVAVYCRREEALEPQAPGIMRLAHRLETVRYALVSTGDQDERTALLGEVRDLVREIERTPGASPPFRLNARLVAAYAEGTELVHGFNRDILIVQMNIAFGRASHADMSACIEDQRRRLATWETTAAEAVDAAYSLNHPLLSADAHYTRTTIRTTRHLNEHLLQLCRGESPAPMPVEALAPLMREAEEAMKLYVQCDNLEGELRAKMLLPIFLS
jgi:hypothetical protein